MTEGIRAPNVPLGTSPDEFLGLEVVGTTRSLKRFTHATVLGAIEAVIDSFVAGGGVIFTTLAQAAAHLNYAAYTMAWVIADSTAANNGVYQKSGASGTGSWTRLASLPYSFYSATNSGAGTPDAIVASNSQPIASENALIVFNITDANTSSTVTVALNGGDPLTIKTSSGNSPAVGGFVPNMLLAGYIEGGNFRLLTDQASAAIQTAAEAAQAAAEAAVVDAQDAADAAIGATGIALFATKAAAEATTLPASTKHLSLAGYTTAGIGPWKVAVRVASGSSSDRSKLRSTDRFLPDGSTDSGNGGWWQLADVDVTPLMFGAAGDGTTNDTDAVQAMFDYAPVGANVYLHGKAFKYTSLTISKSCTVRNGHLKSAATSGTQITVDKAARVDFYSVELSGGGTRATYAANHNIIAQLGTSNTDRAVGMGFYRCYVHGAGMHGIFGQWTDDVRMVDTKVSDCAYAGVIILSPMRFRARDCFFEMLDAVGASGNAYGLALSYDSTNYNLDANAGKPTAVNHFPIDSVVDGCTFVGPYIWEALDIHGAYQTSFINNKIYAAKYGIMFGNGSGAAANYAGYQNMCCNNVIDVRGPDGGTYGVTPANGITLQGGASGTTGQSSQLIVSGNVIRGYGDGTPGTNSVSMHINVYVDLAIITGNLFASWKGYGAYLGLGTGRVIFNDNMFERMSAASPSDSSCIYCNSDFTGHLMAMGNMLDKGGNQPSYGLRNAGGGFVTYGSDFRSATTNEYLDSSGNGRKITYS